MSGLIQLGLRPVRSAYFFAPDDFFPPEDFFAADDFVAADFLVDDFFAGVFPAGFAVAVRSR